MKRALKGVANVLARQLLTRGTVVKLGQRSRLDFYKLRGRSGCQVSIGDDCFIQCTIAFDREGARFVTGDRCFIGASLMVAASGIEMGDDVIMSWGVTIVDHNSHPVAWEDRKNDVVMWNRGLKDWSNVVIDPVVIEDRVWIGFGASILKGVRIGREAVIGAGAVVTRDVPPGSVVGGNPARVIRQTTADRALSLTSAWVTGARGFIGRHLARYLRASGIRVGGVGSGNWALEDAGEWGVSDWQPGRVSRESLNALAARSGLPDHIFHAAGGGSVGRSFEAPMEDFERTVVSTAELLEWMRSRAPTAKLIVLSSAAVYGDGHDGAITDTAQTAPYSPYGAHKFAMEQLCRGYGQSFGLNIAVARLFSVYGAGLTKQLLWDLCGKLDALKEPIILGGTGGERRDWTHVEDVARGLASIADAASPKVPIFNMGTGQVSSVREIAACVAGAFGLDAAQDIRFSGQKRAGDPFSLVAAPFRLNDAEFAWRVNLEEGISDYVRWFREKASQ